MKALKFTKLYVFDTIRYLDFYNIFAMYIQTLSFRSEISFTNYAESQFQLLCPLFLYCPLQSEYLPFPEHSRPCLPCLSCLESSFLLSSPTRPTRPPETRKAFIHRSLLQVCYIHQQCYLLSAYPYDGKLFKMEEELNDQKKVGQSHKKIAREPKAEKKRGQLKYGFCHV